MIVVSHSVFKEQKKHQRILRLPSQAFFPLERRVTYAYRLGRSTAFLNIFLEQFPVRFSTRLAAHFISNKAGHHTHFILPCNPFFKLFFRTISCPFRRTFQPVFVSNKAGKHTHKKNPCNCFSQKNNDPAKPPRKT
jgi:hypothetical protein